MFDPYREWLSITDERRPPTLYQLLGILPIDADPRTIEAAVNRQLAKVQSQLTGPRSESAWQLVDEITLAKTTLLDPNRRAAYDAVFGFSATKPMGDRGPPSYSSPVHPGAGWDQPKPPVIPAPWKPTPAVVLPPLNSSPPTPISVSYQPPAVAAAPAFNPLEDHDPPSADGLPAAAPIGRPRREASHFPALLVGGGLIALGLVGGVIFLTMQGSDPKEISKSKTDQAVANPDDSRPPVAPKTKVDEPTDIPKKVGPLKKKEPKKIVPKKEADPPPKMEVDEDFKQAKMLRGHATTPQALAVSPDGKQLLSGGAGVVNSWLPGSDKPSVRKPLDNNAATIGVGFLRDGKDAVIADPSTIYLIDLATNVEKKKWQSPAKKSFTSMAVAADGQHFATGTIDGQLCWWNAAKENDPEQTIDASGGLPLECVAISPDGKYVIAGNRNDGKVSVWSTANGAQVKTWKAHVKDVTALACSLDGKRLVSTGDDNIGRVWELLTGTPLLTLKGHEDVPVAAAFSVDGSMIFTAGIDMTIRSWDAVTGDPLRFGYKSENKVFSMAVDPRNRFVIAGLNDGGIQMLFLPIVRPDSVSKSARAPQPKSPLPAPFPAALESAVKSIRDRYSNDFAQTDPEEQGALFDKLMQRARHAPEEPAVRYALFMEARDLAGKSGRMADAIKAIDARARWFDTDELEDKAQALKAAGQGTVNKSVIEAAIALVEDAEKQVRPDIVSELLVQNELFPQSDDTPELTARIQAAKKRWMSVASDREASRKLAVEYQKDPENASSNEQYGVYLCLRVGDWAEGLPKLLKCDNAALRDVARKELASPKEAKEQIELGKAWFDFAVKADDLAKPGSLARSKFWYEKGVANLPATERLPIGARLVEINKQIMVVGAVTLAKPGEPVTRKNFNTIRSHAAIESQWTAVGSDGYMPEGLLLKAEASLASRFKLLDHGRIGFSFVPDGRLIKIGAQGEEVEFKPPAGTTDLQLSVERSADELVFAMKSFTGAVLEEKRIKLAMAKQTPTSITFRVAGPAVGDGMRVKSIVVSGPVQPMD